MCGGHHHGGRRELRRACDEPCVGPQRASELRARGQFELHGRGHHVAERGRLPHRFGQRERAACAAGFSCGLYDPETIFANTHRSCFTPEMDNTEREARYNGWQKAVRQALTH